MTEQRYGYTYHRVLIDSERILTPQFDPAVIYVTGAQLEMLRNMTQYLNRLSTYVSEYKPGYYLSPTIADYDTIRAIVADLEETLMGNPNVIWGYKERWSESIIGTSTGTAYTDAETPVVPAGMVYVLEHWSLQQRSGAVRPTVVQVTGGTSEPYLYEVPALPANELVIEMTHLTLSEGDTIRLRVYNIPTGQQCQIWTWGYKMVVPEE